MQSRADKSRREQIKQRRAENSRACERKIEQNRVKLSGQNGAEQSRALQHRTEFVIRAEHCSREQRGRDESEEEQRKAEKSKGKREQKGARQSTARESKTEQQSRTQR